MFNFPAWFWIFWSLCFIIPYGIILIVMPIREIENKFVLIPGIAQFISIIFIFIMIVKAPCFLIIKTMEFIYKKKYKKYEITPEYMKILDPFDEEEWDEVWRNKINENKFYRLIKKI